MGWVTLVAVMAGLVALGVLTHPRERAPRVVWVREGQAGPGMITAVVRADDVVVTLPGQAPEVLVAAAVREYLATAPRGTVHVSGVSGALARMVIAELRAAGFVDLRFASIELAADDAAGRRS